MEDQSPVQLEYESPRRDFPRLNAPSVYAGWFTAGLALCLLLMWIVFLIFHFFRLSDAAGDLVALGFVLLFTFLTAMLGGSFPKTRLVAPRTGLKYLASIIGFLLPGLPIIGGAVLDILRPSEPWQMAGVLTILACCLITPFTTVAILVGCSSNHLPNQRDTQQDH